LEAALPEGKVYKSREELVAALTPFYGPREANSLPERRAKKNEEDGSYILLFRPHVGQRYAMATSADLTPIVANANFPVLFMNADPRMGAAMSPRGADDVKKRAPKAKVVTFDGAGHVIHRQDPEKFVRELLKFTTEK
jgi:pimeloyl-ACP methyl ester carboxylesterase